MTLVIMAAGIGSRYAGGVKQLEKIGPHGETFVDLSVYNAAKAGFTKVVFIIRKGIETLFFDLMKNHINRIANDFNMSIGITYQDIPCDRVKPYGTGHAILCCKDIVDEPFLIINADDYYDESIFYNMYNLLVDTNINSRCFYMAGYILKNTVNDECNVTRGICNVSANNFLKSITETYGITIRNNKIISNNCVLDPCSITSMNVWGVTPALFKFLEDGFKEFLKSCNDTDEYILPSIINNLLERQKISITVFPTNSKWIGLTSANDKAVAASFVNELFKLHNYDYFAH